MNYEIKIKCSFNGEMQTIRALLLIPSLFLNEIMTKGEGKPGICQESRVNLNLFIPFF